MRNILNHFLYIQVSHEDANIDEIINFDGQISIFPKLCIGYFQNFRYPDSIFAKYLQNAFADIFTTQNLYSHESQLITESHNSVAVCIRKYEELSGNSSISSMYRSGKIFEENDLIPILSQLNLRLNRPLFVVFATVYSPLFISKLTEITDNILIVTSDLGYDDTISSLKLMSDCNFHVITTSTYYWWGAYLSEYFCERNIRSIYSTADFNSKTILPHHWKHISSGMI